MDQTSRAGREIDHPDIRIPPPLIFLAGLIAGFLVQELVPLPRLPAPLAGGLAALCLAVWAGLTIWGVIHFRRARTPIFPFKPTTALITDGPFRSTRNPLYLGMTLLYAGVALWANALWPLVLFPLVLWTVQRFVVLPEERYLERKFGDEYRDYRARVRRWL